MAESKLQLPENRPQTRENAPVRPQRPKGELERLIAKRIRSNKSKRVLSADALMRIIALKKITANPAQKTETGITHKGNRKIIGDENSADLNQKSEYKRVSNIPESQMEALSRGTEIWKDKETTAFYPENPLVPSSEGIHLRIDSPGVPLHPKTHEEWQAWERHWAKVIGMSKVISEGADLPDMWQSLIGSSEYTRTDHLVTDIIGRNPKGESWGQTVPFPEPSYDHRESRIDEETLNHLGQVMGRYMSKEWVPNMKDVVVFPQPLVAYPPGSEEFQFVYDRNTKLPWPWQSEPLFVGDQIEAVAILVPHLQSGIHLMIGQPNAPERPWHNTSKALEALLAAEAIGQIFESERYQGVPLAAWTSTRATGSWFGGFQKIMEDPLFTDALENDKPLKPFKRRHRGVDTVAGEGDKWKMGMGFHPHVYGARYPDERIQLTLRPATEKGKDWEGIKVMDEGKRHAMRDALNRRLPRILNQARGNIVNIK